MSHATSVYGRTAKGADFGNSVSWLIVSIPARKSGGHSCARRFSAGLSKRVATFPVRTRVRDLYLGRTFGQVHQKCLCWCASEGGEERKLSPKFRWSDGRVLRTSGAGAPLSVSHYRCWHAVAAKSSLCSLCPTLYLGKAAWIAVSVVQLLPLVRAVGHVARCFTHCHQFFWFFMRLARCS